MIALVFAVCALSVPFHCQPVQLVFTGDGDGRAVTPIMCALRGQAEISHWLDSHPGFARQGGYRCGPVREARR